jgi:hypothetical protein
MNRFLGAAAFVGFSFAIGCGGSESSSPGSGGSGGSTQEDASTAAGAGGSGVSGSTEMGGANDASVGPQDAFYLGDITFPDGPIGACAACIRDMCQSDLAMCASDPTCQMGVICSLQNCTQYLAGGMGEAGAAGLTCLLGCFGDIQTALTAVQGLTCVTTTCASTCGTLIDAGARD